MVHKLLSNRFVLFKSTELNSANSYIFTYKWRQVNLWRKNPEFRYRTVNNKPIKTVTHNLLAVDRNSRNLVYFHHLRYGVYNRMVRTGMKEHRTSNKTSEYRIRQHPYVTNILSLVISQSVTNNYCFAQRRLKRLLR